MGLNNYIQIYSVVNGGSGSDLGVFIFPIAVRSYFEFPNHLIDQHPRLAVSSVMGIHGANLEKASGGLAWPRWGNLMKPAAVGWWIHVDS